MDCLNGKPGRNLPEAPLSRKTHTQAARYGTGTVQARYRIVRYSCLLGLSDQSPGQHSRRGLRCLKHAEQVHILGLAHACSLLTHYSRQGSSWSNQKAGLLQECAAMALSVTRGRQADSQVDHTCWFVDQVAPAASQGR